MDKILEEISQKGFNKQKYVDLIIRKAKMRKFILTNMIKNPKIMVYYHCFYIIQDAIKSQPELFYEYWDDIFMLLSHRNSYRRDFGLIILANLAKIDKDNLFSNIIDDYLALLYDERFSSAQCCVNNCCQIAINKSELLGKIVNELLTPEKKSDYSDKQKALLMSDILVCYEKIMDFFPNKKIILNFAERHLNSISPKTRKISKTFLSKFG